MSRSIDDCLPPRIRRLIDIPKKHAPNCWEWTGTRNADGYGTVRWRNRTMGAHRAVYEILVGDIDIELDHLCRNRGCVNPNHLEDVDHRTNVLRGISPAALHAAKTHCKRGHPFDDANTIVLTSKYGRVRRACRACRALPRPPRERVVRTHCSRGHELSRENAYQAPSGRTFCRECQKIYDSRRATT